MHICTSALEKFAEEGCVQETLLTASNFVVDKLPDHDFP